MGAMATNQIAIFVCINLCFNINVINHFHSSSLFMVAGHFAPISLFRRGFYIELNSSCFNVAVQSLSCAQR